MILKRKSCKQKIDLCPILPDYTPLLPFFLICVDDALVAFSFCDFSWKFRVAY